jgi:hypothetical protein
MAVVLLVPVVKSRWKIQAEHKYHEPKWCNFHSIDWESRAFTCFEHYLLILKRSCTNGIWYTACVYCQLALARLQFHCKYGAPCKARNFNVVNIWTYVWQR